jgi:predicted small metal-binding protein
LRVIDCECGTTIKAASDDELASEVRQHMQEDHPGDEMSAEQVSQLVADRAYEAADA